MRSSFLFVVAILGVVAACSSTSNTGTQTTDGVDDVSKACAIRAEWTKNTIESCINCTTMSTVARCQCASEDYAGSCSGQQTAYTNEPTCNGVTSCVAVCQGDCACVDKCYAGLDACRKVASARDGCVAAICDQYCR